MADFRKDCYSGSLTLVKECGPVRVNVWPGDKEVDVSLEDPDSEYTITGGGGSAEYVIPEQDVTFVTELGTVQAVVDGVNVEGLNDGAAVVIKVVIENVPIMFDVGTYTQSTKKFEFGEFGNIRYITNTSSWKWQMPDIPEGTVVNVTVVKNF